MITNIDLHEKQIPAEYKKRVAEGQLGGVMLVFVTANDIDEMDAKKADITRACKRIRKKYDEKAKR